MFRSSNFRRMHPALFGWIAALAVGCEPSTELAEDIPSGATGTLHMPLVTSAESGNEYYLDGYFEVAGPENLLIHGTGDVTAMQRELAAGSYHVALLDGWQLSLGAGAGERTPVDAHLAHAAALGFTIAPSETTRVGYEFLVGDEPVVFGPGLFELGIRVRERGDPTGAGACDDGRANGDESDVDCGGTCPQCGGGQGCNLDQDCGFGTCTSGTCGTALPSGVLLEDTTLTADAAPYVLTGTLQIGATLRIDPGAMIIGKGRAIEIHGALVAAGTETAPVRFDDVSIVPRGQPDAPASMDIGHAVFEAGSAYDTRGSVYAVLNLHDSVLRGTRDIYLWYPEGEVHIERNVFLGAGGISIGTMVPVFVTNNLFSDWTTDFAVENWASYGGVHTRVSLNTFADTDRIALSLPAGYDSSAMEAGSNYWLTTDPAAVAARIHDRNDDLNIFNTVPFQPLLSEPHEDTPSLEQ